MISHDKNVSGGCVENGLDGKTFTKRASDNSVTIRGITRKMEKGGWILEIFRKKNSL